MYSGRLKKNGQCPADQQKILQDLIKNGQPKPFLERTPAWRVKTYEAFKQAVPIRDYEQYKPYIEQIKEGKHNVLWKGQPIYFAKTSGTTSGVKYIPITKDSISNHINTARNALLCYMATAGNNEFADGKMIFLSGSPELERVGGIPTGRLSGIVNHHIPRYLRTNQLPSYETNCIEEWETKLDKIVEETIEPGYDPHQRHTALDADVFRQADATSGKEIKEFFPNLSVMVHGGVNFEPYKAKLFNSIGKKIDTHRNIPGLRRIFCFPGFAGKRRTTAEYQQRYIF